MDRRHPRNIPARPLVLIVDDHNDTRDLYLQSLVSLGFETIGVADCQQAYRHSWESHPDIVVMDLPLRGDDGWQAIQDLRGKPRTRDIPVVLLTGHAAPSVRERAEREGCAALFVKPCVRMNLRPNFGTFSTGPLFMNASPHLSEDGDTRPRPLCRYALVLSSRCPVLSGGTALGSMESPTAHDVDDWLNAERELRDAASSSAA